MIKLFAVVSLLLPLLVLAQDDLHPVICEEYTSIDECIADCTCRWCNESSKCDGGRRYFNNNCSSGWIQNDCPPNMFTMFIIEFGAVIALGILIFICVSYCQGKQHKKNTEAKTLLTNI